ncbi:DUF4013 domain-containing protein [Haloarcula salina]|uniref:DUF4013 domain-containing protein n=1 Tax=Haloarcula salina TaxID=1429914 RepID=A0AA41FXF2_9EURY|nr:DUF4013 domain-containing protein [Haloarcula salina]MBV0900587.1 DUF4013 domain-containing protein [Haloarcula salina]
MDSIGDSLRYPMEDEDWLTTVVIGGVLTLLGVFFIPILPVYGYIVRAINERVAGATQPPEFDDWGDLFVDGIKAWVIGAVYMLIPGIVAAVVVGGSLISIMTGTRAGVGAGMAGLLGGLLISAVLSLVFGYVAVAAVVHFSVTGDLSAAFDIGTLRQLALSSEYATAWLVSVVLFVGANIAVNLFNVIPFVGSLIAGVLTAFATFYVAVVATDLWASGYKAALEDGEEAESVGTAPV